MKSIELLDLINIGETSTVQFKENITSPDSLAAEMVAFSNTQGGTIIIGVKDKTGSLIGLENSRIQEIQTLAGNVATSNVIPSIYFESEVVNIEKKNLLLLHIKTGINKPYKDRNLAVWVKQGSDKRKITDNSELLQLFQKGGNLLADEMLVPNTSKSDLDEKEFREYFQKDFKSSPEELGLTLEQVLRNKNIIINSQMTLGGLLFFGKNPQQFKPNFCIKAVSFFGNDIGDNEFRDSKDILGKIPTLFYESISFFKSNLKKKQKNKNFNFPGEFEISLIAIEEIIQNALVHRDYLKNSPIRILIFENRIEIISPGNLPNNLTIDNIKFGNTVIRNNLITTFCINTLPYRGLGSGIRRSIKEQPDIDFINDVEGEQFIVKIPRPKSN